ncbi:MAG: LysE family translocator [Muribaculaceae bacterium]|nr:LysE family translocator [Muribaculaceae bacterium]
MIWRGLAIGMLISAPMGPVGILCIQRTLDKGRKAGFYTGIGAAISDLFYCLLTGFGLSFIEDFLNENQNVIQLVGSLVLIAFSVYLFKKNPSSSLRRPLPQEVSVKKNILGGFLFTFSNPLIIFLIIGLFARFNFTAPEIKGGFYAVGYLFIILGALGWWYGVTYLIDKVRAKFNMKSMKKMNIVIGVVILAFACVGIVSSLIGLFSTDASARRYSPALRVERAEKDEVSYSRFVNSSDIDKEIILYDTAGISSIEGGNGSEGFILDFKLRNNACHPSKKFRYLMADGRTGAVANPPWGIYFRDENGEEMTVMIHCIEYSDSPISSRTALSIEASLPGGFSFSRILDSGADMTSGPNHFRFSRNHGEGLTLRIGNRTLCAPISFQSEGREDRFGSLAEVGLVLTPAADVSIGREMLKLAVSPGERTTEFLPEDISYRIVHSSDPLEGRWSLFDYSLEEDYLRLGGEYEVAIIGNESGEYEILYLSGARIAGAAWSEGMLKGRMKRGPADGVYDAEWYDAEGLKLPTSVRAQLEGNFLTFHFPRQQSQVRFVRQPY